MSACPHTEQFLLEQLSRHPASQLQDLRKALYQSAFGCGHLVEDPSAAADWIRRETAEAASADQEVERLDGPWSRVPLGMLADGLTTLEEADGATVAVPSRDTVKLADSNGYVTTTTERSKTWLIQTPQAFRREELLALHCSITERETVTDDCMLLERAGRRVKLVMGSYRNLKITTPEDRELAEFCLGKGTE